VADGLVNEAADRLCARGYVLLLAPPVVEKREKGRVAADLQKMVEAPSHGRQG
jgi:hypothetical protein